MKVKSVKAKGRALQNLVRNKLRKIFVETSKIPRLHEDDIKSQTMGMPGEDIILSPKAKVVIPYCFECKNVERLSFWATVEQAESNTKKDMHTAIVIKKNRKDPYVAVKLEHFMELIDR